MKIKKKRFPNIEYDDCAIAFRDETPGTEDEVTWLDCERVEGFPVVCVSAPSRATATSRESKPSFLSLGLVFFLLVPLAIKKEKEITYVEEEEEEEEEED